MASTTSTTSTTTSTTSTTKSPSDPGRASEGARAARPMTGATLSPSDALAIGYSARVPIIFWGPPGVGKSRTVEAFAARHNLMCKTVIGSICEPTDVGGYPVVDHQRGAVRFVPPAWANELAQTGRGVLFLDELSTAPPAVQKALLRVILDRVVGELALPETVYVVAAANPPEIAVGGFMLSAPMANRLLHLDWPIDPLRWCDGMERGWEQLDGQLPLLEPRQWEPYLPLKRALVAAFIRHKPVLLHQLPKDEEQQGRAWPSHRTWDYASRILAVIAALWPMSRPGSEPTEAVETKLVLLSGLVGTGAAHEFITWERQLDLPDPEEVLANPASLVLPERSDLRYATIASICAVIAARPTRERWHAGWEIIARVLRAGYTDLAVEGGRLLVACRPSGALVPPIVLNLVPLLRKAGVDGV